MHETLIGQATTQIAAFRFLVLLIVTFIMGGVYSGLANPSNLQNFMAFFAQCGRRFRFFALSLVPAAIAGFVLIQVNGLANAMVTALVQGPLDNAPSAWTLTILMYGKTFLFIALFLMVVLAPLHIVARARRRRRGSVRPARVRA